MIAFGVWAVGAAVAGLWGVVTYCRLRKRIDDAVLLSEHIYETDQIDSPFVLGFFRPRIYLPVGLTEQERRYVLLHEQAHIRRWDHRFKPLAYALLCLHWFDPVLWIAYRLLCLDIEMATDQAVLRRLESRGTHQPHRIRRCPAPPEPGPAVPQRRPPRLWGGGREGAHRLPAPLPPPGDGGPGGRRAGLPGAGGGLCRQPQHRCPRPGPDPHHPGNADRGNRPRGPDRGPAAGSCRASEPHKEKQLHPLRRPRKAGGTVSLSNQDGSVEYRLLFQGTDLPRLVQVRSTGETRTCRSAAFSYSEAGDFLGGDRKNLIQKWSAWCYEADVCAFPDRAGQIYAARVSDAADLAACEALLKTMDLERTLGPYTVTSQPEGQGCNIVLALTRQPPDAAAASGPTAG